MKKALIGYAMIAGLFIMAGLGSTIVTPAQSPSVMFAGTGGQGAQALQMTMLANMPAASTATARNVPGALMAEKSSRWSVVSQPAAGTVGSASIAAEAAVRHVVDCISYSGDASGGAVTAAAGTFVVRDGATGAGTIIWSYAVAHLVAAAAGVQTIAPHSLCGLNLVGTTNTAMTAEFNAGVTNEVQGASLSGFNLQ